MRDSPSAVRPAGWAVYMESRATDAAAVLLRGTPAMPAIPAMPKSSRAKSNGIAFCSGWFRSAVLSSNGTRG